METTVFKSEDRGRANHGWLKATYSFSFANYYNPENIHFGVLRVLNDDIILPSMGFGTHPHDNMEIITIPLKGELSHKDSMGHESIIKSGEVQVMSAGTGITHSEFNASSSESLNLFQIWIFPREKNVKPRYDQKAFEINSDNPVLLVSPDGRDESLWINQDAFISRQKLIAGKSSNYSNFENSNGIYLMVIDGNVKIANNNLGKRDAIGIKGENQFKIEAISDSEILIIEVPV